MANEVEADIGIKPITFSNARPMHCACCCACVFSLCILTGAVSDARQCKPFALGNVVGPLGRERS